MTGLTKRENSQFEFMRRCYHHHSAEQQTGYRSALFDATHLLDAMAADLRSGRPSKAREAEAVRLKRMGDLVWQLHEEFLNGRRSDPAGRAALAAHRQENERG